MLTKDDLQKIRGVVREEVEAEVGNAQEKLESDLRMTKVTLANRIDEVDSRVKNSEIAIKREIKKVVKKLEDMDNFLDKELIADRKRIVRIEEHLNFPF